MAVSMIGPKFNAWDRNGKPLAFGKLYTYQARTNTPKPTYQSEDADVENTNPVILNGEGYANVYLVGSYKMVLKDSDDNEIWSADPVTAAEASEWGNCLSATYVSSTSFRVAGNFTDKYEPNRKVRINNEAPEYAYSLIANSVYAANETTVTIEDPVITTGLSGVCLSIVSENSAPAVQASLVKDSETNDSIQKTIDLSRVSDTTALKNLEIDVDFVGQIVEIKGYYPGWAALSKNFGDCKLRVVLTADVTPNNIDIIQSIFEPLISFQVIDVSNATNLGCIGAASATETKNRIQRFFDLIGTGGYGEMDEYKYIIDGPVSFEEKINAHIMFKGDVNILSTDKTQAVLKISGRVVKTTGILNLGYDDSVSLTISDVDAVGLLFTGLARSSCDGFRIKHVGLGCKIDQNTGFNYPNGQNALFSVTFNLLDISDFSYAAFDFRAFNGGNTGNYMANFYMTNFVGGVVKECDRFGWIGTTGEWTFGQINFERGKCRHLMTIQSDVSLLNMQSVHIEGVIPTNPIEGFFYLNNNTTLNIESLTLKGVQVNGAELANYSIFRVADNVNVNVTAIDEQSDLITNAPNLRVVRYSGTGLESLVSVQTSKLENFQNLEFGTPQGLKPALTVKGTYPADGVLTLSDSSFTWSPPSSNRNVLYKDMTTARSFIVNVSREYEGMSCEISNADSTFNVNVSLTVGSFTGVVSPGERKIISFDGTDYSLN